MKSIPKLEYPVWDNIWVADNIETGRLVPEARHYGATGMLNLGCFSCYVMPSLRDWLFRLALLATDMWSRWDIQERCN